ncbi:hypothetical protein K0651_04565 [Ornithinimicrobium sp. Arc0846-15]|nr:hypothetical protein [Ornithinimicrobium laminariae]
MTKKDDYVADWLRDVESHSKRFSVLFVQLGAAHHPVRTRLSELQAKHVTLNEYLTQSSEGEKKSSGLVVIHDVADLAGKRQRRMGETRAQVMADLDRGDRFLLVSESCRGAFPPVPGSSLIEDAKVINGPMVPNAARVDSQRLSGLPGYDPSNGIGRDELLRAILADSDSKLLAALEYVCWERFESPRSSLEILSAQDLVDLRSSGLVQLDDGLHAWTVEDCWKEFRIAVADAVSAMTAAPVGIEDIYRQLWEIERMLRMMIGSAARETGGNHWRKSLFSAAEQEALVESARRDTQPTASSVADLRDPLEWLTLTALFDLRINKQLGDLGVAKYFWPKLASDLVPIRNRIAHNRIPRTGDQDAVRKWHTIICRGSSPGRQSP